MLVAQATTLTHTPTTAHERAYADMAIAILRGNDLTDAEILAGIGTAPSSADSLLELQYHQDTGQRIRAARVKMVMRQLLTN